LTFGFISSGLATSGFFSTLGGVASFSYLTLSTSFAVILPLGPVPFPINSLIEIPYYAAS